MIEQLTVNVYGRNDNAMDSRRQNNGKHEKNKERKTILQMEPGLNSIRAKKLRFKIKTNSKNQNETTS